jgi:hypothetical protein
VSHSDQKDSEKNGRISVMNSEPKEKPQIHFTRPRDQSLEAFREWILNMVKALNPSAEHKLTDQQWEAGWKEFWKNTKGPRK